MFFCESAQLFWPFISFGVSLNISSSKLRQFHAMSINPEKSLSLFVKAFKHGEESKAKSEIIRLGDVDWVAEAKVSRQSYAYPGNTGRISRLYSWYSYHLTIKCILPDDVKYYNCLAEIEHTRYWAKKDSQHGEEVFVPETEGYFCTEIPATVERLDHRFSHLSREQHFTVIVEPHLDRNILNGPSPEVVDSFIQMNIRIKLISPLPPVCFNDCSTVDSPWNDLAVVCDGGRVVRTNRAVLASCSPFFRSLLYGNFKEQSSDRIELPSLNAGEFEEMLNYLHPGRKPVTEKNVEMLLDMADKFLISCLTEECEKFLLFCKPEDLVSSDDKFALALNYRLPFLKVQCEIDAAAKLDDKSCLDDGGKGSGDPCRGSF